MRYLFVLLLLCSLGSVYACDNLPQCYTSNNINPYKSNWFNFLSFAGRSNEVLERSNEERYDYMLSRLEREWFERSYSSYPMSERLNRLEEHVFGTSFNEAVDNRCERLKRAFNAQKQMVKNRHLYSGVPTSIPFGVDELIED